MSPENYLEFLRVLINFAVEYSFRDGVYQKGTQATEPGYCAVLVYVKHASPELQKWTEPEFIRLIQIPGRGHELAGYCMRELKYPSVKEAVQQLHDSIENRGGGFQERRILEVILAAYEAEWRVDRRYSYHSRKHGLRVHPIKPENYIEVLQTLIDLAVEYRSREGVCQKGIQAAEPGYFAVLTYVKYAFPEFQQLAELEFIKVIQMSGRCDELVSYCMRQNEATNAGEMPT